MNKDNLNKLISESLAIEARDARESGALGYMARALVQATLRIAKSKAQSSFGKTVLIRYSC